MIRRPPRSTLDRSSAASDVYKRQDVGRVERLAVVTQDDGEFVLSDRIADDDVARPFPVSYTHLRAHETVLDLVCRLLLEQTKEIQPEERHSQYKHAGTDTDQHSHAAETER